MRSGCCLFQKAFPGCPGMVRGPSSCRCLVFGLLRHSRAVGFMRAEAASLQFVVSVLGWDVLGAVIQWPPWGVHQFYHCILAHWVLKCRCSLAISCLTTSNLPWFIDLTFQATVRTGHGTTDWFQIGKGVCQGCILSPCLLNLYAEYIMRNAGLEEAQVGIKIAVISISIISDMQMTPPLWQKANNNYRAS